MLINSPYSTSPLTCISCFWSFVTRSAQTTPLSRRVSCYRSDRGYKRKTPCRLLCVTYTLLTSTCPGRHRSVLGPAVGDRRFGPSSFDPTRHRAQGPVSLEVGTRHGEKRPCSRVSAPMGIDPGEEYRDRPCTVPWWFSPEGISPFDRKPTPRGQ